MVLMISTTMASVNNIRITGKEQLTSQMIKTCKLSVDLGADNDFNKQYINRANEKQQLLPHTNSKSTEEHNPPETQKQLNQLKINVSTTEFRINKYNGSKNIYINVTDSFNILTAANLTIYTNMTDPNLPVAVSQISVKDKLKKAILFEQYVSDVVNFFKDKPVTEEYVYQLIKRLGFSLIKPRPRNIKQAPEEERDAFKK